jgi:MHS family proline/betaine transporter-like MFS transporter
VNKTWIYKRFKKHHAPQTYTLYLLNFWDHFDSALYSFLAPWLGVIFFPTQDILLASMGIYGVLWTSSLVAAPAGAFIFGLLAKRFSPEYALRCSALGVGISTLAIACLPSYSMASMASPLLLIFFRGLLSLCAKGDHTIIQSYGMQEKTFPQRIKHSMKVEIFTLSGLFSASMLSMILVQFSHIRTYLWRLPFFVGGVAILFLLKHRRNHLRSLSLPDAPPCSTETSFSWKLILEFACVSSLSYVTYATAFQVFNVFIPKVTSLSFEGMLFGNTFWLGLDMLCIIGIGRTIETMHPLKVMRPAALALALTSIPLFWGLKLYPHVAYVFFLRGWIVFCGVSYALPLMAWLCHFSKGSSSYLHIGLGTVLGTLFLGYGTPVISLFLYRQSQWVGAPGVPLTVSALLALFGQARLLQRKKIHDILS